jgi:8-amino-3,8-dideoxy-alpha-D-manno-octulosonate transaminase
LDQEEESAVLDVLRKGSLFRYYGPDRPTHVNRLEQWVREFYGTRYALAVNSGTGALCTALSALGIGPGCEVIVPTFLWVATVSAVVQSNAVPVLCEIDDSFNLDSRDLKRKINERTKLIIAVHMAGSPCDMKSIMNLANEHGIPVLEDCAQCNGGSFIGRKVGTFGKIGMFSLQINKNVTAGEGGLLITQDEALYRRLLAAHDLGVPWKKGLPEESSQVRMWGQGRRMSELNGSVANIQLRKLPQIVTHMQASKQRIRKALQGLTDVSFRRLTDPEGDTGPFLILMFSDGSRAIQVLDRLESEGVRNAFHLPRYGLHIYYNITSLVEKVPLSPAGNPWNLLANQKSVYEYGKGTCPVSDELFERSILIPVPSRLSRGQEDSMIQAIRNAVQ